MANSVALQGGRGHPCSLRPRPVRRASWCADSEAGQQARGRGRGRGQGAGGGWMGLGCRVWDRVGRGVEMAVLVSLRGLGVRWGGTCTYRVYLPMYVCGCRSPNDEQAVRCWWRWCFRRVRVRDWGRE
jgi:hypothetical protein